MMLERQTDRQTNREITRYIFSLSSNPENILFLRGHVSRLPEVLGLWNERRTDGNRDRQNLDLTMT